MFLPSAESYEPEAVAMLRNWLAETSRTLYCVGPLLPSGKQATIHEDTQSVNATDIHVFMDRIYETHGAKSLLYVCESIISSQDNLLDFTSSASARSSGHAIQLPFGYS